MSVGIPNPMNLNVALDVVGPVEINGIPDTYHVNLDHVPKIQIGVDPVTINPITLNPLDVSVRLKEFPSIRAHLPADFKVGLSVLGFQLVCLRVCGEGQIITEPYVPNPCERCEPSEQSPPHEFVQPVNPTPPSIKASARRARHKK
jgi:hypothetical protein